MSTTEMTPTIDPTRPDRRKWLYMGILLAIGVFCYLPSFGGSFLFDDYHHIVNREEIRSVDALVPMLLRQTRPMMHFSIWLNYQISGLDTWSYHLLNLAVHLAAGLTLFGIVSRTLKLPLLRQHFGKVAEGLGFVVALIWLVHPLQTQSVTYIIQRCESMMGLFYLLCLYCVLRGSESKRPWAWYLAGLGAGYLGMGCKAVMITAPLAILLFDRVFLSPSWKAVWQRRWAFYAGLVPAVVWLLSSALRPMQGPVAKTIGFQCDSVTPWEYFRTQPGVILHYLRLSFLPDKLCIDYMWPVAHHWTEIYVPGLAVVALLAASLIALRYWPPAGFLGFGFFLILAPTSSIMPIIDIAVEHRMYLPLACVMTLVVCGAYYLGNRLKVSNERRRVLFVTALTLFIALLVVRTFVRNRLYGTSLAFWKNTVAAAPHNFRAHANYGNKLAHHGHPEEGIAHLRRSLELKPDFVFAHDQLARLLVKQEQPDVEAAMKHFREITKLNPDYGSAYYHLGILLAGQGKNREAIPHFLQVQRIDPDNVGSRFRLGKAYQQLGDHPQAIAWFRRTLELDPAHVAAQRHLAECLAQQQRQTEHENAAREPAHPPAETQT
jgi:tetratricopeptide (TPR) repeat protein